MNIEEENNASLADAWIKRHVCNMLEDTFGEPFKDIVDIIPKPLLELSEEDTVALFYAALERFKARLKREF